jgi:hypothetical protein
VGRRLRPVRADATFNRDKPRRRRFAHAGVEVRLGGRTRWIKARCCSRRVDGNRTANQYRNGMPVSIRPADFVARRPSATSGSGLIGYRLQRFCGLDSLYSGCFQGQPVTRRRRPSLQRAPAPCREAARRRDNQCFVERRSARRCPASTCPACLGPRRLWNRLRARDARATHTSGLLLSGCYTTVPTLCLGSTMIP